MGRNDPCPCGSGAKVKKCHLGVTPPADPAITDSRLWPLLAALTQNVLTYLSGILPPFAQQGFSASDRARRSQNLAVAYYACVAYRVGSAILTLVTIDQGEEADGLRRELVDARIALAYYQEFPDEAAKLVGSRVSNLLAFERRMKKAGLDSLPPGALAKVEHAAQAEQARLPEIIGVNGKVWSEPSIKAMSDKLYVAWANNPHTAHVGRLVDEMMREELRGSPEARSNLQHAVGNTLPSQALHNTFVRSNRYIYWGDPPYLRPLTNSMEHSPNQFLEVVTDSIVAVVNGIHRQTKTQDDPRLQNFAFALRWFQRVLAGDTP